MFLGKYDANYIFSYVTLAFDKGEFVLDTIKNVKIVKSCSHYLDSWIYIGWFKYLAYKFVIQMTSNYFAIYPTIFKHG